MAEAEVTINYRERRTALVGALFWVSLPVVSLFVFLCALGVANLSNLQLGNLSFFYLGLFALFTIQVLGLLVTSDKTIFLTRDGISLPFILYPKFALRTQLTWSEVTAIRFLPKGKRGVFQLLFRNGRHIDLKLDLLPDNQIESLCHSLDVWVEGADAFPALLEVRASLNQDDGALKSLGYTQIWEDELSRRFRPTNFIPLEPGQIVRELKVERQLAFGGFSAIYLVKDSTRGEFVLKEAVVPTSADPTMQLAAEKMLGREAQMLASLSHPNIAKVIDHFLENGRHYMLSELIPGDDLRRLVKEQGAQKEEVVVQWALQLLAVMDYLHSQREPIIHRDLSPDNLVLGRNGEICVIDFGAANHFAGTATGTLIGKQAYIAPEQLRGKAEPRSDIYAFGCTLFFLLTGSDPEPLAVAHAKESNKSISFDLDKLIAQCTAQEANDRPSTAAEITRRLNGLEISRYA